ncbi:MAG: GSCFA domain-containing protein [Sphingomicrobium sp.]
MVGRSADNRVEPECWPHIEPGFAFAKDQLFFAIGSCFAKNIAKRLVLDGYNVHGGVVVEGNRRNRYTPAAIYQELAWAKRIFDRDDMPRDEDVLPLLLELGPNRWTDIWSRPEKGVSATLEQAIETRKELYGYFRGAFVADVVIITLGLIEAWWDDVSQSYVEFDTPWARREDKDRFSFERLSFERCRAYTEQALDLVTDGHRRVLITTSPVVLARTFTGDDIIVANTHSKSVLRAVAGEVSAERQDVDYFPSYEIATITRRPEVWDDDLIHINPNFVARIMQHVTDAYVPGSVSDDSRAAMRFAHLVEAGQYDAAQSLYDGIDKAFDDAGPAAQVAAMRLALHNGDPERAIAHAARVDVGDRDIFINHPDWMFDVAETLRDSVEQRVAGEALAERLWSACSQRPPLFQQIFRSSVRSRDQRAATEICDRVLQSGVADALLTHKIAAHLHAVGRYEDALALCMRQLAATPDHPLILARIARLHLVRNEPSLAIDTLRRLTDVDPQNGWAWHALGRSLLAAGRPEEALQVAERLIDGDSEDAVALTVKARALWKLRRRDLARETARSAISTGMTTEQMRTQLQPILQSADA